MAIAYDDKIAYINENNNEDYLEYYDKLPDTCPVCNHGISPEYILIYEKYVNTFEVLCGCPKDNCGSLFFAVFFR